MVAIQAPKDFPNGSERDATIGHVCKKLPSTKSGRKETKLVTKELVYILHKVKRRVGKSYTPKIVREKR